MAVSYSFEGCFFFLLAEGEYTPADLKNKMDEATADPDFPDNARFIFDVTGSLSLNERRNSDVEDMAEFLSSRSDHFGNICAIVAQQPLHFGLMRMGSAIAEYHGMQTSVFESQEEAKKWLTTL